MELKFRNLTASEIEARIARSNEDMIPILLYKDARCDQRLLDETVGPMNWQKRYTNGNANCIISIWDTDKKQWVEKEDVGMGTGADARKATASDACKRACAVWGLGRELYTAPKMLVPKTILTNYRVEKDGAYCDNEFCVKTLDCTDDHFIIKVEIDVLYNGSVVYSISAENPNYSEPLTTSGSTTNVTTGVTTEAPKTSSAVNSEITEADVAVMYAKAELAGSSQKGVQEWIEKQYKITNVYNLTATQYQTVCRKLDEQAAKKKN